MNTTTAYPRNREEWEKWLDKQLGMKQGEGRQLYVEEKYPVQDLVEAWRSEFSPERGYSSDFVPALIRNKKVFLDWVLGEGSEPNWSRDDSSQ